MSLESKDKKRGLAAPVSPDEINLITSWRRQMESEGLTLQQAIDELNQALGTRLQHGRVASWQYGRSRPGVDALSYMLEMTLSRLLMEEGLSKAKTKKILEQLKIPKLKK